jgi:hypothetical protein
LDPKVFLLLNLALAFYNAGTIWAHEIDIFRSWKLLDPRNFHAVLLGPVAGAACGRCLGFNRPYLTKILNTHWVRTLLVNANALILLL